MNCCKSEADEEEPDWQQNDSAWIETDRSRAAMILSNQKELSRTNTADVVYDLRKLKAIRNRESERIFYLPDSMH
jgi:hypothetical protein